MPLTEFQKAFIGHELATKEQIIDPETGEVVDWAALAADEASVTQIFEGDTFINNYRNQPNGVAGLDGNAKVGKGQTRYVDAAISYVLGNGTAVLDTGLMGFVRVPFACTITGVDLLAEQAGDVVIDIHKSTYEDHPTNASICASAKPTLSAASKYTDSTLTGWTTAIDAGDVLSIHVDSVATLENLTVVLHLERS